jgi:N-acetylmuramoyl-L-alanine amidase
VVAVVFALLLIALQRVGGEEGPSRVDFSFSPHGTIRWSRGAQPQLLVEPRGGDGWITIAQRYTGGSSAARAIKAANPRLRTVMRDRPLAIPLVVLRADLRLEAVRTLFAADRRVPAGWEHWVVDPFGGGEESWEWLAELFTGRADLAAEVKKANPRLASNGLRRGKTVVIPAARLLDVFGEVPAVAVPEPEERPVPTVAVTGRRSSDGLLGYGRDERGEFALYKLRKGEALYSSVVVRFTGQMYAKQVNATAAEIAARSDIDDVTDIPIGYPIKIPLELVLARYLPVDNPVRMAWEEDRRELAHFLEVVKATDLSGVHVVLDAGHGGADTGAVVEGLWEATYAYDIVCRIKRNLEQHTRAKVYMIRKDGSRGFTVPDLNRLQQHRDQFLVTRPQYGLEDSVLGVHLRWYLTNDIILNRIGSKVLRSKTVFVSVHADSLHPSLRGAMVYVPSRYLRPSKYTVDRRDIKGFQEFKNHPTVRLGPEFKARVEASSRHLAENIVRSLNENEISVHPDEPVRDRVLRGRRSWVPAVLRYTAAQNAVLLECCNMANEKDRALLVNRKWREEFARGVVEGMAAAFSGSR